MRSGRHPVLWMICALLLAGAMRASHADSVPLPAVDRRIEFLSIVYRLAGLGEFADPRAGTYSEAVDAHFRAYANHPAIVYVRQMNRRLRRNGIDVGSWEVLSLALHVTQPPKLEPLVPRVDSSAMDGWDNRDLLEPALLDRLRAFYRDARCEEFFAKEDNYFRSVERALADGAPHVDGDWFTRLLAVEPTETYTPIASLLGVGNLSYIRVNFTEARRNTHTIIAMAPAPGAGWPAKASIELVARSTVHEHTHSFVNQLVEEKLTILAPAALRLLAMPGVAAGVKGSFYDNPRYLMYESLVRAISIRYLLDNAVPGVDQEREIAMQERVGFLWMRDLLAEFAKYQANRERYPTFRDFMPQIALFFDKAATQ